MTHEKVRGRVLVVEDESYVRDSLGELLRDLSFDVQLESSAESALAWLGRSSADVVLSDLKLGATDGLSLVRRLKTAYPGLPVVILTGHGTIASAVECVKAGAQDYLLKPADPAVLEVSLERALAARALQRELRLLRNREETTGETELPIGQSACWQEIIRRLRAVAPTEATVLLLGESGTGKELLARLVHRLSARADRAYVRVNCAAIPIDMWESEFFGHRRGAFTGATADRDGRFLLAHRGTLFMDEIGTMPLSAQSKILRVIEDGEFQRLGDDQPTRGDVRIVAATNSDLAADVAAGRFRQDLFYRLNVVPIHVPPLRERMEDVPLLVSRFVVEIGARLGRPAPSIADHVLADLLAYSWPGNVRELRNVLERAMILDAGTELVSLDLPPVAGLAGPSSAGPADSELNLRTALTAAEQRLVVEALKRSGGVRKEAARLLGIDQRNLPYYLRKHGIDPTRYDG